MTQELTLFLPTGKAEVQALTQRIIALQESGEVNALEVDIKLKGIEEAISTGRKATKDLVLEEATRYAEKTFELAGAQVQKKLTPAVYDYATAGDPVYNAMQVQMADLKDRIKSRETFLKSVKGAITMVDDTTGEVYVINEPSKSQGETIAIKFL